MIRKTLKLQKNNFSIDLPDEFVGKEIEVLIFPIDKEATETKEEIKIESGKDSFLDLDTQLNTIEEKNPPKLKLKQEDELKTESTEDEIEEDLEEDLEEEFEAEEDKEPIRINESQEDAKAKEIKFEANVLVAEDNDINQQLILRILGGMGLTVSLAQNGLAAVQQRKKEKFDIIFMDVAMPIMDGIEATKAIKKYEKENDLSHIPIVAFTANTFQGDREHYMSQGVDEYMTKPIKKERVIEILEMFLNGKPIHQAEEVAQVKIITKKDTKPKRKNHVDILICRKNAIETNVAKSIISQLDNSCDICNSLDELRKQINSTHYSLVLFDYELEGLNLSKMSQWKRRAQTKHKQGDINFVMFAENSSDVSKVKSATISEVIKGFVGKMHFENLINQYVGA